MDKIVITIQSDCAKLFNKQLVYLKEFGIKIIDYHNTSTIDYLMDILKLKEYQWIISINESTFISDYDDIIKTIEYMNKNNIVIGGFADGGINYINNGSPYIYNSGFNIFNIEKIDIKLDIIQSSLKKWEVNDHDERQQKCNNAKKKAFLPYKPIRDANIVYRDYYPIYIYLLENYKSCFFNVDDTDERYYTTCPPINIYSPNNKVVGIYCGYGQHYTQNKLKIDISVNNIVTFNNRTRMDYFYNKTCIGKLIRLSISHNSINYYYHNYIDLYHKYFDKVKSKPVNILTIGDGNYLDVLGEYFNNAKIYTIIKNTLGSESSSKIDKCDITCERCLEIYTSDKPVFDIIIDTGSYRNWEQLFCLSVLFKKLQSKGIYICENIQVTNNLNRYGLSSAKDMTNYDIIKSIDGYRPFPMTNDNYIHLIDNKEHIDYSNDSRRPIKCINCGKFINACECEIKQLNKTCVIIKR